jgi:hypothetical protein
VVRDPPWISGYDGIDLDLVGWFGLGMVRSLDKMMGETWRVSSKVSGRLCVNLGCVATFGRVVVC